MVSARTAYAATVLVGVGAGVTADRLTADLPYRVDERVPDNARQVDTRWWDWTRQWYERDDDPKDYDPVLWDKGRRENRQEGSELSAALLWAPPAAVGATLMGKWGLWSLLEKRATIDVRVARHPAMVAVNGLLALSFGASIGTGASRLAWG